MTDSPRLSTLQRQWSELVTPSPSRKWPHVWVCLLFLLVSSKVNGYTQYPPPCYANFRTCVPARSNIYSFKRFAFLSREMAKIQTGDSVSSSYSDAVQILTRARNKRRQNTMDAQPISSTHPNNATKLPHSLLSSFLDPMMFNKPTNTSQPPKNLLQSPKSTMMLKKIKKKPLPILGYNAQDITYHYDRLPLAVAWRLNSLSLPLLQWYFQLLVDRLLHQDTLDNIQRLRGQELRQHFIRSQSVALIKSGQALSLRPDLIRNAIWAEELGKLVDAVGGFDDRSAMNILAQEWNFALPSVLLHGDAMSSLNPTSQQAMNPIQRKTATLPVIDQLVEFEHDNYAVASASIGQVYKARITDNVALLGSIIGPTQAQYWMGKLVAIKIQRPDVVASASLDMYLLRRAAEWASKFRGGDLVGIADAFGMQLFGELDYIREANNCQRFRELYHGGDIIVPQACLELTTKKVLVLEWIEGDKGPWRGQEGLDIVQMGLKCSVDQLLNTGLFHGTLASL